MIKNKEVLWVFSELNPQAFDEGWQSWTNYAKSNWLNKGNNPYKKNTNNWYSWKCQNLQTKIWPSWTEQALH